MRSFDDQRRWAAIVASCAGVAGVLGVSAIVAAGGGASADAELPAITFDGPLGTAIPPGPTFNPPFTVATLVPGTFITVPPFTLVTVAPSSTGATTTSTATPASSEPESTASTTVSTDGEGPGSGDIPPRLEIVAASIDCAGLLHLEYFTEAQPEPAPATDHVIMVSPLANPAAIVAQQLIDRPTNSVWVFDVPAPSVESYRIAIVADFQPDDLNGILLVDEAEAVLPADCPTG